jgi:iron complex transport system substrate-binding protein
MKLISYRLVLLFLIVTLSGFSQDVKRVISLTPSITENIYLIGAQNKLVGCTSYCTLALEDEIEQVGSAVEVNVEKILTLNPDIVLTMGLTKSQDVAMLRKLGIKVEVIPTPKTFEEICEQNLFIGQLIGNLTKALQAVQESKEIVSEIQNKCKELTNSQIFFQLGANPVFTVLEGTFMNDFITICNGENIAKGMKRGVITREAVLLKNPDVIIIATMGGFGEEEKKVWESYKGISAVKNKKIFLVASETSCSPTPDNFARALTDIYENLTN